MHSDNRPVIPNGDHLSQNTTHWGVGWEVFNSTDLFLTGMGSGECKRNLTKLVGSGEDLLWYSEGHLVPPSPQGGNREIKLSLDLLRKTLTPSWGLPSCPHGTQIPPKRLHLEDHPTRVPT